MAKTNIEWADKVWNPITGCTPISAGCQHCYAARMANRLRGRCGYPSDDPFRVTFHADRLEQPFGWRKAGRVFVCSMADLFHEGVSFEQIDKVMAIMAACVCRRPLTFMLLTKRAELMRLYFSSGRGWFAGAGVWLGVTAESQQAANERIPLLQKTYAALRFVSVEPMLGPVDLQTACFNGSGSFSAMEGIGWVICGAETGPKARKMEIDWALDLLRQCRVAGIPFFFKKASKGDVVPAELMVREFPENRMKGSR